ncbi:c-type cytochrome [Tessaracoccus sp. OH4464_COT-324]|uniref:cytochrome bc1 complex diheme cytochrome c subunit n=1 Tax=Tessaracoccus sp. OH4464_COT-324 TaxID=2491059 RepID=UPI000F62C6D1|nr:c-type cytochrome [Tessaracoccus sp. OH4464_COT-324]RRD45756.1 cystathionine beta-lyase [Tessaracoccus sp. OH4464_COT-324]
MNTDTKRKRKAFARPWLLVLALFLVGVAYSVTTPQPSSADSDLTQQLVMGKEIYDTTCSSCHGLNGEGQKVGVSLIGVGGAAVDFQMGTGRMPANRGEAQIPTGPVVYTQEQIDAVAAYVATFGPGPAVPEKSQYSPEGLTTEEIAHGGSLFRANCSACHGIIGGGGAMPEGKKAPSLANTDPAHIWEAVRSGPQQMPMFSKEVLADDDVRQIIGYVKAAHAQPRYGGFGIGDHGPVTEGMWIFIVGLGLLAVIAGWIAKKGVRAR